MGVEVLSEKVVDLLVEGKVGAIFQGKPEMGSRALGNRSIIAAPRLRKGKDLVNKIKRREWYRPFAASILEEECKEWFDMGSLKNSPHMLYAVPVNKDKWNSIPAVIHVDGTCRVQTVNKDREHYYEIIRLFYEATGVPILLNTSLNLAGQPLVHTKGDAVELLKHSELDFIYFPEEKEIIYEDSL